MTGGGVRLADRVARLGTETAFAVSAEAAAFAATGRRVFPFHLGDLDLTTPSTVVEAAIRALRDGKTGYCPNAGIPELREALAADVSASHGVPYTAENVIVQPGGKPTIGKFILALMNPGDEVLYPNPGYPIYESLAEFHGGVAVPYGFVEDGENFRIDFDALERGLSHRTRLLILNDLQNPTGAECSEEDLARLAALVREHDLHVLCDEAYFDIRYEGRSRSLVEQPGMVERCVILYTFSKKFAMTGWRLGASIAPEPIAEVITTLNVNDESCSNHFIQHGAVAGLLGDQEEVEAILSTLRERRDAAAAALDAIDGVRCYRPPATFYLFPDVTAVMARKDLRDEDAFRKEALHATGVSFCGRHHFGRPRPDETSSFVRFAYSGLGLEAIEEGIARFGDWCES